MIVLNNKIRLFVPIENNDGNTINCNVIKRSMMSVTNIVGGGTTYDGEGSWVSDSGLLMRDRVRVTEWCYDRLDLSNRDRLTDLSNMVSWVVFSLIQNHQQYAVSVEVNGTLYIIEKNDIIKYSDDSDICDIDKCKKLISSII